MAAADGKAIIKRRDALKTKRSTHEARWERHAPYMAPWSVGITAPISDGASTQTQVYDSTGIFANDELARFLCSELINPSEKYISYKHPDPELQEEDEVKEWTEECTDRVLAAIAKSNFYTQAPTMIAGMTGFGTGCLFRGERLRDVSQREAVPGFRGFRFDCYKIGRFLIACDPNKEINTNFVEFTYTTGQIRDRWGESKLPDNIKQQLKEGKLDEVHNIIFATYPRTSGDRGYGGPGMPYAACYVLDGKEGNVLEESGFESNPYTNPRWDIIPGEDYGRCPGDIAFNDILTVNSAEQLDMESWALDARPPTFGRHDSIFGSFDLVPGMFMGVRVPPNMRMADAFWQYTSGAQHQINEIREEKKKDAINAAYHVQLLRSVMSVPKTEETAYQFGQRMGLVFQVLGPIWGRFQHEFMKPTFDGLFDEMYRRGELSQPPDIVVDHAISKGQQKVDLQIEYHNPIARAQKKAEVDSMNFALGDLAPMIEMEMKLKGHSATADWIDEDKWAKKIFEVRGVPATTVRSDKEVEKIREARKQAQEQQNQEAAMAGTAEGLGKIAPFIEAVKPQQGA